MFKHKGGLYRSNPAEITGFIYNWIYPGLKKIGTYAKAGSGNYHWEKVKVPPNSFTDLTMLNYDSS